MAKTWPELVGLGGNVAKSKLEKEDPSLYVVMIRAGELIPIAVDRPNTVRLWLDVSSKVYILPKLEQPPVGAPKMAWPELKGKPGTEAQALLLKENPSLVIDLIHPGELRPIRVDKPNTVRLWLDVDGLVSIVPKVEHPSVSKTSWPELVGIPADKAKGTILKENPSAIVDIIPSGELRSTPVDKPNTVRLWLDAAGLVQIVPKVEQPPASTGSGGGATKTSWPELVGVPGDKAKETVLKENPSAIVDIIPSGELRSTRVDKPNTVRLWLDAAGLVQIVPKVEQPPASTGSGGGATKTSWPEIVGVPGDKAKETILKENPSANVDVIPSGELRSTPVDKPNTVRLWLDAAGLVQIVPKVEQPPAGTGSGGGAAKTSWPELVGVPGDKAKETILKENPSANVDIIPSGELRSTPVDKPNTVRLWLDAADLVQIVPKVEQPTPSTGSGGVAAKTSWPELVGVSGDKAKGQLVKENPSLNVDIIPFGDIRSSVIDKPNTVRLWLDAAGLVQTVPKVEQPAAGTGGAKTSWPELVGKPGKVAREILLVQNPSFEVDVIPSGELRASVIEKPNTVRLWLDADDLVQIVPTLQQPAAKS